MNMMEMRVHTITPMLGMHSLMVVPDSNIICIDKIRLVLLQLIDSKSAKDSA